MATNYPNVDRGDYNVMAVRDCLFR